MFEAEEDEQFGIPQFDQPVQVSDAVQEISLPDDSPVPCERLIGCAGTGKTTEIRKRVEEDSSYGLLSSTTGISAINLGGGAITVHSTLKFSDTLSLRDAFLCGRLSRTLHGIGMRYRRLIIEEYSMLHADQLDLIYQGIQDANRHPDLRGNPLGIMLVGDLSQLPPVKGEWCFNARCWGEFASHTQKLTKVWRQDGGLFLDSLNLLRGGDGAAAAELLDRAGVRWNSQLDNEFEGTTILPKNDQVNRYNTLALSRVEGREFQVASRRWGKQRSEWGENQRSHEWGIPPRLQLKVNALVMVLANASDFSVVNGDLGHVLDWDDTYRYATIELVRTGEEITLRPIVRGVEEVDRPEGWNVEDAPRVDDEGGNDYLAQPHFRRRARRYVMGQVEFLPLRLAYATSVHKSQSLTLDSVQADIRDRFFGMPSMLYTAMSRCRTLEGLRLVGSKERFAAQCSVDSRIAEWI